MLTGDNALVAREVARMAGVGERVVSVKELRERGASLEEVVDSVDGLAEVFPEDKFNVVKAFQSRGHVVAMTGDGVNDAPALSQAEVGIAVAGATDAAKAAASMVLLEEGLKPIVDAVTVGRVMHERASHLGAEQSGEDSPNGSGRARRDAVATPAGARTLPDGPPARRQRLPHHVDIHGQRQTVKEARQVGA